MTKERIRQYARDCFLAGFDNDDVNIFIHVEMGVTGLSECQRVKEIMIAEYEKLRAAFVLTQFFSRVKG